MGRVVALLGLALSVPIGAVAEDPGIDWGVKSWEAVDRARQSGKPVLVDVWAVWCVPCKAMEETTYRDPRVIEAARGFVPVKVDADLHDNFVRRYEVDAFPTVLILDGEGDVITRMVGMIEPPQLLGKLRRVQEGYATYLLAKEQTETPDGHTAVASYLRGLGNESAAVEHLRRACKLLKKRDPERRESTELLLAQVLVEDGDVSAAARIFERLSGEASRRETRADALARLQRLEAARGHDRRAGELAAELRTEYPDLAERLLAR